MSQEKSEALVLRGVDFSETSRIMTFLTPGRGRLSCIAKGVRRKNSALAPVLDTMNRVELVYYWKEGRAIQNLAEASLLDPFGAVKSDLERGAHAAFPLEIALNVAHDNEPCEDFYGTLLGGLEALKGWRGDPAAHCAWQAARLMAAAGFRPELYQCVHCGGEIGDNSGFDFDAGAVCARCAPAWRIARTARDDLRALFGGADSCPALAAPREAFRLVRRYVARQTECDYRSLRVLDEMFP